MSSGTFFKVDKDSVPENGQILFRYLPVHFVDNPDDTGNGKLRKCHHFYPVYAVLKPHAVDFFYHGPDKECQSDENTDDHH
ncbi:MAG: hypothetical protein ACTSU4_04715, partial [Promethearchaeota archaeon]